MPDILNSHIEPPRGDIDHYIPPKTKNDVPKNFIRPEDLPPSPELLDDYDDYDDDVDDFGDDIEITLEDLESLGLPGLESLGLNDLTSVDHPFLGLAKFKDGRVSSGRKKKKEKQERRKETELRSEDDDRFEKLRVGPGELQFPPMPTHAPNSADSVPIIERLRPEVLAQLRQAQATGGGGSSPPGFIPGKAGVDYPDFRSIPATDFTCENFILPGFYADTFTSCQVFHVCEEGKRQSSFLCPRGTIFNQEYRVCDWWYNVKCEDSSEYFDLNLDLMLEDQRKSDISSNSLGLDLEPLVREQGLAELGPLASKVDFGLLASELGLTDSLGNI